jgi:hypothetical protein
MKHFRARTLIADEKQAKRFDQKYSKWRCGPKRQQHFKKYCYTQPTRGKTRSAFFFVAPEGKG